MTEKRTIDDYFPECEGRNNAKLCAHIYLWGCYFDPSVPCSRRYTIPEAKYAGEYFCRCIRPQNEPVDEQSLNNSPVAE